MGKLSGGRFPHASRLCRVENPGRYGFGGVITPRKETQNPFIHRPGNIETERGVKPVFHIVEILVRQQLYNHCRHFGFPDFVIFPVAVSSQSPHRVVQCTQSKVYSESNGEDDYTDDYKSRALWVNYLAGGSPMLPDSVGLKIL